MSLFSRRKRRERTVYFPWERRGLSGALALPRRRVSLYVLAFGAFALVYWIYGRDQRAKSVRITRAAIARTQTAVDAYRMDHAGKCPKDLVELTAPGDRPAYLASLPTDGWRRPLRFSCPARDPARVYDLLSDGPDGEPYGLDRIE